jgi:signal peptidase II
VGRPNKPLQPTGFAAVERQGVRRIRRDRFRIEGLKSVLAKIGGRMALLIAICATIGCDRVTKQVAAATLAGTPSRSFLADTIRLEYVENVGAFLGLGAEWPPPVRTALFIIGTGALLVMMVGAAIRFHWPDRALLGLALFVAGGASNWFDRLMHGSVIDFMNVGLGPMRTGIFNVADMAIMLGAGIVVFASYRSGKDGGT